LALAASSTPNRPDPLTSGRRITIRPSPNARNVVGNVIKKRRKKMRKHKKRKLLKRARHKRKR